ncbi:MAG TPA: flavin reductase [Ramlibacter sp.]|uniref:flavin reductase n=1 Tax=Ramlibacter sp. TaxID=1917967 RepID=UPI002C61D98E|nr:flavin reductase [Ramlibacter sp.]HVZ42215.1 flavin reductase [Ramlibacter sp.]
MSLPNETIDPKMLRSALGTFPTGVAVMTTKGADGRPVGLTCNSFNSVSLDPPLVSWSLRLASSNLQAFTASDAFTVNILAEDQTELSSRFARKDIADKFAGVPWREGLGGAAVLEGCVASFQCEKFAAHVAGDHVLFLGKVVRFEHGGRNDSLLFYRGAYMMVAQSLRELVERCTVNASDLQHARRLIACLLVELACARGTENDFAALDANLERLEEAAQRGDVEARLAHGLEFFRLIAHAAHNEVLMAVSESLTSILRQVLKTVGSSLRFRSELLPARRRLVAALRARDVAGAEREITEYFRETSHLERDAAGQGGS